MGRRARPFRELDAELEDVPEEARWREWMGRVEAVIFASPKPVPREVLASMVGRGCNLDEVLADIREELRGRPYELVAVAGGFHHRTRAKFGSVIRSAGTSGLGERALSHHEGVVLTTIAYFQPVTRSELSEFFGREVSRDTLSKLRREELIASGPRSPQAGAPYTYVTTAAFLSKFGFESLRDLPDVEQLEEAGLLNKLVMFADPLVVMAGRIGDEVEEDGDVLANVVVEAAWG